MFYKILKNFQAPYEAGSSDGLRPFTLSDFYGAFFIARFLCFVLRLKSFPGCKAWERTFMKTTYLVKKNPELPTGKDNWIIMNGTEFMAFRQTKEGKKRSNNFIRLCTEFDDECIVMECDLENLIKWKSEVNHAAYVQKIKRETGFSTVSYHQFEMDGDEMNGEDLLMDMAESVEEQIISKMEVERLLGLVGCLCEEDQDIIYSFYLTTSPMVEAVYAKEHGMSQQLVHYRKERAIKRLKNLYFS